MQFLRELSFMYSKTLDYVVIRALWGLRHHFQYFMVKMGPKDFGYMFAAVVLVLWNGKVSPVSLSIERASIKSKCHLKKLVQCT